MKQINNNVVQTETAVVGYFYYTYFEYEILKVKFDKSIEQVLKNGETSEFKEFVLEFIKNKVKENADDSEYGLYWKKGDKQKLDKRMYAVMETGYNLEVFNKMFCEVKIYEQNFDTICKSLSFIEQMNKSLFSKANKLRMSLCK